MIDHDLIRDEGPGRWAAVATLGSTSPEELEEALRRIVDGVLPKTRGLPGWKGSFALATDDRRRGIVVTLWDEAGAAARSGRTIDEVASAGRIVAHAQSFEIVFDERAEES